MSILKIIFVIISIFSLSNGAIIGMQNLIKLKQIQVTLKQAIMKMKFMILLSPYKSGNI